MPHGLIWIDGLNVGEPMRISAETTAFAKHPDMGFDYKEHPTMPFNYRYVTDRIIHPCPYKRTGDQFWSRTGRARMDGRQFFGVF